MGGVGIIISFAHASMRKGNRGQIEEATEEIQGEQEFKRK
jgi:hypothetical protein